MLRRHAGFTVQQSRTEFDYRILSGEQSFSENRNVQIWSK
jgi:hypothetical protein